MAKIKIFLMILDQIKSNKPAITTTGTTAIATATAIIITTMMTICLV